MHYGCTYNRRWGDTVGRGVRDVLVNFDALGDLIDVVPV